MACRWRIRHKLILGLGLVIALIALLLVGSFKGLWSYHASMGIVESKLAELKEANHLWDHVKLLAQVEQAPTEALEFKQYFDQTRLSLTEYQRKLKETLEQGHALDRGQSERHQIEALDEHLQELEQAFKKVTLESHAVAAPRGLPPLVQREEIAPLLEKVVRDSNDLVTIIYDSLDHLRLLAQRDYEISSGIVLFISIGGTLLLMSLLRGFYCWMFHPIRDLERGAHRVAQGNFEHHIEVSSSDELAQLASAFNHMMDKLRDSYGDLARQVNERSRQLVRSERLASVGFLAAGVAHEINNPLASIAFCSEALEQRLQESLSPDTTVARRPLKEDDRQTILRYLHMIQQEAFRCKEITQRLLEFSRGGESRREPVDLTEIVHGVLEVVQHLQNCRGKHLIYQPPGPLIAWVNAQEIKSVVLNLVVNALESMEEGGTLTIKQQQYDGMAEIYFQDNGCGMTEEVLENIFEPFFTRSRTGKGTGLGLSISHRVINQHGGDIEAASAGLNQGSTFIVRLPIKPSEDSQRPATAAAGLLLEQEPQAA